mmetsp:Transcript_117812/g.164105  ORF Transcript_117812/g.164105 Transcript_117812/m.164105 type:complete len:83 (-) Transcript_117812:980-1228(-)
MDSDTAIAYDRIAHACDLARRPHDYCDGTTTGDVSTSDFVAEKSATACVLSTDASACYNLKVAALPAALLSGGAHLCFVSAA